MLFYFVSRRSDRLADFANALSIALLSEVEIRYYDNVNEVLLAMQEQTPDLVILDEAGTSLLLKDVQRVMCMNAFVHVALLSAMPAESMHEETEGFGLAAVLPLNPSLQDAKQLGQIMRLLPQVPKNV